MFSITYCGRSTLLAKMVWDASLLEFVLNHLVELVYSDICFRHGFKKSQMKKVDNDVFDFIGMNVSTLRLYNHTRTMCSQICKLKEEEKLTWSNNNTCFVIDDDEQLR
jgi:hypothetical protein